MYMDDICIMPPSDCDCDMKKKLLDVCHNCSVETEDVFIPKKSICMIFKTPK